MNLLARLFIIVVLFLSMGLANAGTCGGCNKEKDCPKCEQCCGQMGGVSYCDSSAGRLVCNNGFYSSCYCSRHAVMDLEHIQGCCLWQGGVMTVDAMGLVICNNGGISEVCSEPVAKQSIAW